MFHWHRLQCSCMLLLLSQTWHCFPLLVVWASNHQRSQLHIDNAKIFQPSLHINVICCKLCKHHNCLTCKCGRSAGSSALAVIHIIYKDEQQMVMTLGTKLWQTLQKPLGTVTWSSLRIICHVFVAFWLLATPPALTTEHL